MATTSPEIPRVLAPNFVSAEGLEPGVFYDVTLTIDGHDITFIKTPGVVFGGDAMLDLRHCSGFGCKNPIKVEFTNA